MTVKVALHGPDGAKVRFTQPCLVDTGYSGFLMVPSKHESHARSIGTKVVSSSGILAGNFPVETKVCYGTVDEIEGYIPQMPIEVVITFLGSGHGLIGRNLLSRWIAQFDGPRSLLTILEEYVS